MMLTALLGIPTSADFTPVHYRPTPAIHGHALAGASPWPHLEVGTGGVAGESFLRQGLGYRRFVLLTPLERAEEVAPYAKLMQHVKAGFGRTMSRLPEVFGVSRQTLYNWLEGETPKPAHQERLVQLAEAARVFTNMGFKPTPVMLDRTMGNGRSFLQLLAEGGDGAETAKRLIRIVERGNDSRGKLDALLAGRKAKLDASDIGAQSLDEDA
jgi:transcriptional regulator with XRE-family HTH domain